VPVILPSVDTNSYTNQMTSGSGRLVLLHWKAYNAASCSILLEGKVIVGKAPTDTYLEGYTVALAGPVGAYQLTVKPHPLVGTAHGPLTFPDVSINDPSTITPGGKPPFGGNNLSSIAFTPDSSLAFVINANAANMMVIDLATCQARPHPISVNNNPSLIAITPDGACALVVNDPAGGAFVMVIDIAQLTTELATISLPPLPAGTTPSAIAVAPDGTLALEAV
jgi:hypothetical protein